MKLCIDCYFYGGVKASNGKYLCHEPRNNFTHPVDGLPCEFDASMLRMAPELQVQGCGMDAKWWKAKPPPGDAPLPRP